MEAATGRAYVLADQSLHRHGIHTAVDALRALNATLALTDAACHLGLATVHVRGDTHTLQVRACMAGNPPGHTPCILPPTARTLLRSRSCWHKPPSTACWSLTAC